MPDELTNDQIALLCEVGEYDLATSTVEQRRELEQLLAAGYIEPTENHPASRFQLTAKGAAFLGERGAGLNEA
jgi:predicted transcriptional regulator